MKKFFKKKKKYQRNSKLSRKEIIITYICIPTDFGWERVNFLYTSSHVYVFWIHDLNSADKALMFLINV